MSWFFPMNQSKLKNLNDSLITLNQNVFKNPNGKVMENSLVKKSASSKTGFL